MLKVYSVDVALLVAAEPDVSPQELEQGIEMAIRSIPGVRACDIPQILVQPAGPYAFCCPTCGASIVQEIHLDGVVRAAIGIASGMAEHSAFEGTQRAIFQCEADPSHELPEALVDLLGNAAEVALQRS